MTPEQHEQVEQLFHAAILLPPAERATLLARDSVTDAEVRRAVERLLDGHARAEGFLDAPVWAALAPQPDPAEQMMGRCLDHYQIISLLGKGGMGEVYLARDTKLERQVALKLLPAEFLSDAERVRRFTREAKAVSALNHPNILTIYEICQTADARFIVTEFIAGRTLRAQLHEARCDQRAVLDWGVQIANALAAAHEAGIVHRDLKPENIMVRRDGLVKVLDFGLAKLTQKQPTALDTRAPTVVNATTEPGLVMGTAIYMSPEQARGQEVDARSDIFSLGVVLYEMLAGRAPFVGVNALEVISEILKSEPAPLTAHAPETPAELQRIVSKALRKDREERYQRVKDLLLDLKDLRSEWEFAAQLKGHQPLVGAAETAGATRQHAGAATAPAAAAPTKSAVAQPTLSSAEYLIAEIKRHKSGAAALLVVLLLAAAGGGYGLFGLIARPQPGVVGPPRISNYTRITSDGQEKAGRLTLDGSRLYFSVLTGGSWTLAQVASTGGETVTIPAPLPNLGLLDFALNRSALLVSSQMAGQYEHPLWVLPLPGGAPHRLGEILAHDAVWSPEGSRMVYTSGSDLYLANSDGTDVRKLLTVEGRLHWLCWSPDGGRVRFTLQNLKNATSLWEIAVDGTGLRPLLANWNHPAAECCGQWTADGKYYVFQVTRNRTTNIWALREQAVRSPQPDPELVQLTFGPLNYSAPVPSRDGRQLFVIGEQRRGELVRYDAKTRHFVSYLSGISAELIDFSKDGEWIAYVTYPEGSLWRSRVDGRQRQQLTFPPMRVHLPRWSPDGKQIVFPATAPDRSWKIYLVSAAGGNPQQVMPEERTELDPGWSPDGKSLIFWAGPSMASGTRVIHLLDLHTRQVSRLPGGEGFFGPRWSPDGRYIAAIPAGKQELALFDWTTQKWQIIVKQLDVAYHNWSQDGKYLYFINYLQNHEAMFRVRIKDHKLEQVAELKHLRLANGVMVRWMGLAPDDSPLVLRDIGTQDLYALDWQAP